MDQAALPAGASHDRTNGLLAADVSVRDDQLDALEAAGFQAAQEGGPEGAVLGVADVQAQDLAAAVGGDASGDHHRAADHSAVDAGLEVGGVHEQVREVGVG
jgi:hypothetical protein